MTEKELMQYRTIIKEIADIDKRLVKEQGKEIRTVAGKVKASMTEYPYTEIRIGVEMCSQKEQEASRRITMLYEQNKRGLNAKKLEIEQFIAAIEDPQLRLIFRYRYVDGMRQGEIAKKTGYTQSGVAKKISRYLKVS